MLSRALIATTAPVVFAGARQQWLLDRTVQELGIVWQRAIGSAATALEGGLRARTALEADCPASDVAVTVIGRPPHDAHVLWEWSQVARRPAADRLTIGAMRRVEARIPAVWPPDPHAAGCAAALIARTVLGDGQASRSCFCLVNRPRCRRDFSVCAFTFRT
jgi:hypothetical protein